MQQIILQKEDAQLQIAVVECGRLAEYYLQKENGAPTTGSIYRGIVESVLPGMQAAFVDIGWERSAYLSIEDILIDDVLTKGSGHTAVHKPDITDILKAGQSIVVQIKKEAVDAKGPKVTTELSLQGRVMVLLPGKYQVNISKKITDSAKRQSLQQMADAFLLQKSSHLKESPVFGVILRTAAAQCTQAELEEEFAWLIAQWDTIAQAIKQQQKPGLIAMDQNMACQIVRECVRTEELDGIYINDSALYVLLQKQIPERNIRFKLHLREEDLITQFQLSGEIRTIHKRHIFLSNGAELVIDRTEAMNVIDVNTASFIGKKAFAETIVQTNLEAVKEAVWQIRLRNLSGIILIDLIDMKDAKQQSMVLETLESALQQDRVKTKVHGISHLGLVEITRQRTRAPLTEILEQPCPLCGERGRIAKETC